MSNSSSSERSFPNGTTTAPDGPGIIVESSIEATRIQIKTIVDAYAASNQQVHDISREIQSNWVGNGRAEFDAQYDLLLSKIDDFGDTLKDLYDALIAAQGEYQTADTSIRQGIVMSMHA